MGNLFQICVESIEKFSYQFTVFPSGMRERQHRTSANLPVVIQDEIERIPGFRC
jgi:hypothetical protein